ncbi:pyridoxamine 5'-phosphate oxidase family protein [Nocardia sp. NPDC059229]|uniref:pyridoxamine 5'-phosphate oxidase family protein n=1 Tax=Nocardia sp. NPDC059229 TaxID=3346778 RepID=UPI0036CB5CAD
MTGDDGMNRFRAEEAARSAAEEAARSVVDLSRDESMRLLASVPFGRVVFTRDALPAIRPVNHIVDGETLIVRTRLTSRLTSTVRADSDVVVAYEADDIDRVTRLGWSVVVTGLARTITAPDLVARYDALVRPWVDGTMDTIVSIEPTLVTGIRLVERESIGAEPLR